MSLSARVAAAAAALTTCLCVPLSGVIVYVPDELRAESMSVYGGPASTPHFSRLAADGTAFTNAFTTYPVCTQSRAALLTGRFTHAGGHRTLWNPLRFHEPNLLRYAKNASFPVHWYGKNDALDEPSFNSSVTKSGDFGKGESGGLEYPQSDPRYYSFLASQPAWPVNATGDAVNVGRALADLAARNASSPPFFVFLPLTAPHPPYGCAGPFFDMYKDAPVSLRPAGLPGHPDFHARTRFYRNASAWPAGTLEDIHRKYLGCVSYADDVFGGLLAGLDALGLYESTAIFVLADHGDYAGDYGLVEKWPSGMEDVLLRVPLLAKVPGGARGQVLAGLVQHMDVMQTALDLMQAPSRHAHFSVSLLPQLLGAAPADMARAAFAEGGYPSTAPRSHEGNCADPVSGAGTCTPDSIYYPKAYQEWHEPLTVCNAAMVRTHTHKLVRRSDVLDRDHDSELYDLEADPRELVNVYGNASYARVQTELTAALLEWFLQTSDVVAGEAGSPVSPDELPREMYEGSWPDTPGW
jgi:choline-sulfatase